MNNMKTDIIKLVVLLLVCCAMLGCGKGNCYAYSACRIKKVQASRTIRWKKCNDLKTFVGKSVILLRELVKQLLC